MMSRGLLSFLLCLSLVPRFGRAESSPPEGTELVPADQLDGLKLKLLDGKFSVAAPNENYRWVRTPLAEGHPCYMCLNLKTNEEVLSLFVRPNVKSQKLDAEMVKSFVDALKSDLKEEGGNVKSEVLEPSDVPIKGKSFHVKFTVQKPNKKDQPKTAYYTVAEDCFVYFMGNDPESAKFSAFVKSFTADK